MVKKVEILAPAGSYESLKAAISAGADAVYIGGTKFGARAYADNFTEEQLLQAIDYVHLHGRKIYLTVNTLLKNNELKNELYDYLYPYYVHGLDAVIVQDIGVLQFIRKQFPDLPIHASTQMTITNALGASFLEELGVERVVPARELQLEEIKEISEKTNLEIECFVHGALCYCYSGQCLYSSLLGGRSGNRGQCAQPCRLPYKVNPDSKQKYVLSLKDICTLESIPELIEAGIHSFKIEGRMKKPEYVALVTSMYRKYTDLYYEKGKQQFIVLEEDKEQLMDLYNRGGFHGGYYHVRNGKEMVSISRPNHAGVPVLKIISQNGKKVSALSLRNIEKGDVIELEDEKDNFTFAQSVKKGEHVSFVTLKKHVLLKGQIINRTRNEQLIKTVKDQIVNCDIKEQISGHLCLSVDQPAYLNVFYKDFSVFVEGDLVQEAVSQPMDASRIEKQMGKTGNTPFEFRELNIELHGKVFLPMQSINELRRRALSQLEAQLYESFRRQPLERKEVISFQNQNDSNKLPFHVYVQMKEQWETALSFPRIERIYMDCHVIKEIWNAPDVHEYIRKTHEAGKKIYLCMPHIFRMDLVHKYQLNYAHVFSQEWDGVLVRNYESFEFLKKQGYSNPIVTDYNLYQFNEEAKKFWMDQGVEGTTAPFELNDRELADVGLDESELIVYGYQPMMVSAQCVQKTTKKCNHTNCQLELKDRYQKNFIVQCFCDSCYNIIYNTLPLMLCDQVTKIWELNPKAIRLHFTVEDISTMEKVLSLYEEAFYEKKMDIEPNVEFTRGHFRRGIR